MPIKGKAMTEDNLQLPPSDVTPEQLYFLMQTLNTKIGMVIQQQNVTDQRLTEMELEVKVISDAWNAVSFMSKAIKFIAALGAACVVLYSLWELLIKVVRGA